MKYLKVLDDKQAEFLERTGIGEIVHPYDALMERYIDSALDALEKHYNLTKEERDRITPELYKEVHNMEMPEDDVSAVVYLFVDDKLTELRGDE